MKPKSYLKLLSRFLNIPGIWVTDYQILDDIGLVFKLEPQKTDVACPHCQTLSDRMICNHRYLIKDLPLSTHAVYLQVNRRQFICNSCQKNFTEELGYVNQHKSYTKRLASYIVRQVLDSNIESVAKRNGLREAEVESMFEDIKQDLFKSKVF